MLARLSAIDRGRPAEMAAMACVVALGALALWLLVRLIWALVPRADGALDTAPLRVAGNVAASTQSQSIARWHLFGETPRRPGSGPGSPATTLSLILRGTFAGSDPAGGIAVIEDAGHGERAFSVGDEVSPGVRLVGVHPDHVVLRHDGIEETLALPRDDNLAPADVLRPTPARTSSRTTSAAMATAAHADMPTATADQGDGGQNLKAPSDWQQTVAHLRQNPEELMQRIQVAPVLVGGKITGMRLSAGTDAALIGQIGLRPGDVVTSVNGQAVDSLASGQRIMDSLGNATSVRVTVLRDGKPTDLVVGLK